MGLVTTATHAFGRELRFFVNEESTAGTFAKPATGDAAKVLTTAMERSTDQKVREDSRTTRSQLERIQGKSSATWSIEGYLMPGANATTAPDLGPLFEGALGTETISGSVAYSLATAQAIKTYSLTRHMSDVYMESVYGAWVETCGISFSGGGEPKVSFSGGAMGFAATGTTTLDGGMAGVTAFDGQDADGYNFNVGSVIQIGSTADVEVTAVVTRSTCEYTVGTSVTESDSAAVTPYTPAETVTASAPINGVTGSVTFGGVTLPVTGGSITITNGFKPLDDHSFEEWPTDVVPGYRTVAGELSIRVRKDHVVLFQNREAYGTRAITIVLGSGTGTTCTIAMPTAELDFSAVDVPTADEATITVPFTAMGSSGDDEITLTFT